MRRGPTPLSPRAPLGLPARAVKDLHQAVAHANAGRWTDARGYAERVLAVQPRDPSAMNVLGTVALNTGRAGEAITWFERAATGQPKNPFIQYNLGEAHRRAQAYEAAAAAFVRAGRLKPDFAEAFAAAGDTLRRLGRSGEAEAHYKKALRIAPALAAALSGYGLLRLGVSDPAGAADLFAAGLSATSLGHPLRAALLTNLGLALLQLGQGVGGLDALAQAVEAAPDDDGAWRRLARALRHTRVAPATPVFRALLLQLFDRTDVNPRNLATAAIAVLRQDPEIDRLLGSIAVAPRMLAKTLEREAAAATRLVADPLFRGLLASAPIPDVGIELLLVQLRADLLVLADREPEALEGELGLAVALARQAFLNEYAHFAEAEEQRRVDAQIAALDHGELDAGDAARVAIVAAYRPLASTPLAARLRARPLPALADLLREQLAEPAEEAALRAALPILKSPTDAVSLAVRAQYEQNPYPRWTRGSLDEPLAFRSAVQSAVPDLPACEVPDLERPRVLVAGCGTGLETLRVANIYRGASILAVDLSATSLGYAMRKAREYELTEVQHLQADILDLPALSERFDLIDSFGVLHHMADPAKALQVVAELLKPEGFLLVGLYSEIGRQAVVAARAHIARSGYRDDAEGIRALRRDLMLDGEPPELEGVMSPASDFWTLSDCRDLLFHVNEHRFTLLQVGELLGGAGLEFLGVQFGHAADQARYLAENQRTAALRDFERLHRYELQYPETFGDTYRLWARPRRPSR
ncbi:MULTISPECIES: methyltransferase domain-containing protein [Phenylobacterium]|nr:MULTISPECIES: methyltransferase domain-containing protein [Phenylobacterium]MBP6878363.1 methyltransferase domain-containing protein [Phenylobacterium sp.]